MDTKNKHNKTNSEYIDLSKEDLDSFPSYSGSFAEQLANYYFHDMNIAYHRGEISQNEYESADTLENPYPKNPFFNFVSDNGYVPPIEDAYNWSLGIAQDKGLNSFSAQTYADQAQIFQRIMRRVVAGEINGEEARKIATREFEGVEGWETKHSIFDKTSKSEEWLAAQIKNCFNTLKDNQEFLEAYFTDSNLGFDFDKYSSHGRELTHFGDTYESLDELLEEIRFQFNETIQKSFKIGFLYHDAWWKARHEESVRRYYKIQEKNRKNGEKGGLAGKKKERYSVLNQLAREHIELFKFASDRAAVWNARRLAQEYDKNSRNEALFTHTHNKNLSLEWYREWLEQFWKIIK